MVILDQAEMLATNDTYPVQPGVAGRERSAASVPSRPPGDEGDLDDEGRRAAPEASRRLQRGAPLHPLYDPPFDQVDQRLPRPPLAADTLFPRGESSRSRTSNLPPPPVTPMVDAPCARSWAKLEAQMGQSGALLFVIAAGRGGAGAGVRGRQDGDRGHQLDHHGLLLRRAPPTPARHLIVLLADAAVTQDEHAGDRCRHSRHVTKDNADGAALPPSPSTRVIDAARRSTRCRTPPPRQAINLALINIRRPLVNMALDEAPVRARNEINNTPLAAVGRPGRPGPWALGAAASRSRTSRRRGHRGDGPQMKAEQEKRATILEAEGARGRASSAPRARSSRPSSPPKAVASRLPRRRGARAGWPRPRPRRRWWWPRRSPATA